MADELVVQRVPGGVRVVEAAERIRISLAALAASCEHALQVRGDRLTIADQVVYQVTGWEPSAAALTAVLVEDLRTPPEGP